MQATSSIADRADREVTPASDRRSAQAGTAAHPFSHFLRIVGRGATLSRSLTMDEAAAAMGMILDGEVEPVQLGALLLVLRYRKETPEELAGFVQAARQRQGPIPFLGVDLDWPSYADRHRQRPYFLLAALLLAQSGLRIAIHGIPGEGPATTPATLEAFGLGASETPQEVVAALDRRGLAYLPLTAVCPSLDRLFALRPLLGLRSPANTFARELNPCAAPFQLQGVFHPTYLETHQETARLLGQPAVAVFKGGGGEVQRNPAKPCRAAMLTDGQPHEEYWPALTAGEAYAWREEDLAPRHVVDLWRGDWTAASPVAAIVGTAAIALKLTGRARTQEDAERQARELWESRDKSAFPIH